MSKTAILFGAYGQTNIGDELLIQGFLKSKYNVYDKIFVASFDAEFSNNFYQNSNTSLNIEFLDINKQKYKIIKSIFQSNDVIFAGGTLLKTLPKTVTKNLYQSIFKVLMVTIFSKFIGKKIYSFGIGISPFKNKISYILSKFSLSLNKLVTFRDSKSFKLYNKKNGIFSKDLVYNLTDDIKFITANKEYDICINLCHNTKNQEYLNKSIKYIEDILIKVKDLKICFLVMQVGYEKNNDLNIAYNLKEKFPHIYIEQPQSLEDLINVIKSSKKLFVMRFHLGLLSSICGKDFYIFNYDPKIDYWAGDYALQSKIINLHKDL